MNKFFLTLFLMMTITLIVNSCGKLEELLAGDWLDQSDITTNKDKTLNGTAVSYTTNITTNRYSTSVPRYYYSRTTNYESVLTTNFVTRASVDVPVYTITKEINYSWVQSDSTNTDMRIVETSKIIDSISDLSLPFSRFWGYNNSDRFFNSAAWITRSYYMNGAIVMPPELKISSRLFRKALRQNNGKIVKHHTNYITNIITNN